VVDDPLSAEQALSELERQNVIDWWTQTMSGRGVSLDVRRVIIMQRLHLDDLSGHVLKNDDYVHLCLPMRLEVDRMVATPLGFTDPRTTEGQLLCPEYYPEPRVARWEKELGPYGTAGQLQQRPVPKEGGLFKEAWFRQTVPAAPYQAKRVRYWDIGSSAKETASFTVGTLKSCADEVYYVEHVERGQWGPDERDKHMLACAHRDRSRYGPSHAPLIYIEKQPGAAGIDLHRHFVRLLAGFPVYEDRPGVSKEVRAEPFASQCAAGTVKLVDDGTWSIKEFVDELCGFPFASHEDQVDSCSAAFAKLVNMRPAGTLRTYNGITSGKTYQRIHIVVASQEEMADEVIEDHGFVRIDITDPGVTIDRPPDDTHRMIDWVNLSFLDKEAGDFQHSWGSPVQGYGAKLPEDVLASREMLKKLWVCLKKKRGDVGIEVIVLTDSGGDDRRALSTALGICDAEHLKRSTTIYKLGDSSDWKADDKVLPDKTMFNNHVYQMVKSCASMVLGGIPRAVGRKTDHYSLR
jgi:predicted phage terminase large subunit-like protein